MTRWAELSHKALVLSQAPHTLDAVVPALIPMCVQKDEKVKVILGYVSLGAAGAT